MGVKIWRNSTVNGNALNSECSLMHHKGRPSNWPEENSSYFSKFNHVQLHVHWVHLLNTRICRYTGIYITPTVQALHYCLAGAWRWKDVVQTSYWRHHVAMMSFWHHVPAECDQDRCVKRCPTLNMKSTVFSEVYFQQNLDTSYSFLYLLSLIICERIGKKTIARTLCFMHQSFFRPNYIFNYDA